MSEREDHDFGVARSVTRGKVVLDSTQKKTGRIRLGELHPVPYFNWLYSEGGTTLRIFSQREGAGWKEPNSLRLAASETQPVIYRACFLLHPGASGSGESLRR